MMTAEDVLPVLEALDARQGSKPFQIMFLVC